MKHYEMKFIYHTVDHLLEQLQPFQEEVIPDFRPTVAAQASRRVSHDPTTQGE